MKKHDKSVAALTLAAMSLTGHAVANDSDWAQLDQDIQALSASLQTTGGGIEFGGRVRAFYESSSDFGTGGTPSAPAANDLGGFSLYNARLYAAGDISDHIGVRVEVDFAGAAGSQTFTADDGDPMTPISSGSISTPGVRLLDAYIDARVGEGFTIRAGQFRGHVLRSSLVDSGDLFFAERSLVSSFFSGRSQGIAAMGSFDKFNFGVTVQNGSDGVVDDLFYAVRGEFAILGNGTDLVQGAYGAGEEMDATIGAAYFNDDVGTGPNSDGDGLAIDASFATKRFSFEASAVDLGDIVPGAATGNFDMNERSLLAGIAPIEGNTTPFSVQGSFMLTDPTADDATGDWEIGARFQDLDNTADTRVFDVGLNYYTNGMGHNMKYMLNWTSVDSNANSGIDGDLIRVGVQARF